MLSPFGFAQQQKTRTMRPMMPNAGQPMNQPMPQMNSQMMGQQQPSVQGLLGGA